MPAFVLIVDLGGTILAVVGFNMAFRQAFVRRVLGRNGILEAKRARPDNGQDPLTYALRIAGVMIMVFGIAIAGMVTLFHGR
ncbi:MULTISPECIES: hypothetical protein [Sphingomonadaceae]|uniref:hypothetical protein n=1 Tax=Sphingomonadales TaxID=204457 RepID=UPI00076FFDA3|nr:hypothetical protein [Sphingobium sp. TKS]AMK23063.1 hypothetical protein K426_10605 [Sphingobium sp. TKS]MCF8707824.1 hypothetical protein [Rhizorhapis sp. SPR117]